MDRSNEGRSRTVPVPPRSVNPGYGPEQKRLNQYAIPNTTIADALADALIN